MFLRDLPQSGVVEIQTLADRALCGFNLSVYGIGGNAIETRGEDLPGESRSEGVTLRNSRCAGQHDH